MFCGVTSATCPLVDADAPLASDSDNPAAPKTGMALLRRLLFLIARFDMAQFSRLFGALNQSTPLRFVPLRPWRVRNRIGAADRGEYRQVVGRRTNHACDHNAQV